MKNKSTKLAYKWLHLLGGLCSIRRSEIESTAEQVSDMFYYEVLNSSVPLKNGLDREEIKSELRQMRLNPDRWVSAVDWEGIVSLYAEEGEDEPDNVTTFQIPEHYLSLIFNCEEDGYEEEDIKAWEQFEQQMIADGFTNGHWSYPDNYESYFSHSNDVTNLGDNVVDLQWVEMPT